MEFGDSIRNSAHTRRYAQGRLSILSPFNPEKVVTFTTLSWKIRFMITAPAI